MQYYMILDTETANGLQQPLVYDIGAIVVNDKGDIMESISLVLVDTYFDRKLISGSVYGEKKRTRYNADIQNGNRVLSDIFTARNEIHALIKKYAIKKVYAYNVGFDLRALNTTIRYYSKSQFRYFFPYNIEICDIMTYFKATLAINPEYELFAEYFHLYNSKGGISFTAENVYRFITNNIGFIESHTGLEDSIIEAKILMYCLTLVPKFDAQLFKREP